MNAALLFRRFLFGPVVLLAIAGWWVPGSSVGQSPTLDSIEVLPPPPILPSDMVEVEVAGTVNVSGSPVFHSFWQRTGSDIQVDLVDVEEVVGAPPQIEPYLETVSIGSLAAGDYDLTVRLFWTFTGEDTIPDPWDFPDAFGREFGINEPGPLVLQSSFIVIPEPATLVLGVLCLGALVLLRLNVRGGQ